MYSWWYGFVLHDSGHMKDHSRSLYSQLPDVERNRRKLETSKDGHKSGRIYDSMVDLHAVALMRARKSTLSNSLADESKRRIAEDTQSLYEYQCMENQCSWRQPETIVIKSMDATFCCSLLLVPSLFRIIPGKLSVHCTSITSIKQGFFCFFGIKIKMLEIGKIERTIHVIWLLLNRNSRKVPEVKY